MRSLSNSKCLLIDRRHKTFRQLHDMLAGKVHQLRCGRN